MPNRHQLRIGDWISVARRLEELIAAGTGEDPFEVSLQLVLAKLADERFHNDARFAAGSDSATTRQRILELLAEARQRWPGIVQRAVLPVLRAEHLQSCAAALQPLTLSTANAVLLDALFEIIVSPSTKAARGQFFTPRHIIEACVRMMDPQPGERILDPCCGSGGFLLASWRHLRRCGAEPTADRLWGFDSDPRAVRLARVLLLASAGGRCAQLDQADSLAESLVEDRMGGAQADLILTNPPFAGEVRDPGILQRYAMGRGRQRAERDALFLQRCVELLRPGGRLAIVLPHNKLAARSWGPLRQWLLLQARVLGVVGLPRDCFQPHTSQKTCVLLARRRPQPLALIPDEPVLFQLAEKGGKDRRGRPRYRAGASPEADPWDAYDHDLDQVLARWQRQVPPEALHGRT